MPLATTDAARSSNQDGESASLTPPFSVGEAPAWVLIRPVSYDVGATKGSMITAILRDCQHDVAESACYQRQVYRLDTLQAVQDAAQWRLDFDPSSQTVLVHSITVWRGGVAMEQAAFARFRFLQRETDLDRLVIDGRSTAMLLLEDVRIGDVIDASFTIWTRHRLIPEHFGIMAAIPRHVLREYFLRVRFPLTRTMQWRAHATTFEPAISETEDMREWQWTLSNLAESEGEAGCPDFLDLGQWVQVSDLQGWGQVVESIRSKWMETLDDERLVALAEQLAAEHPSVESRAAAALTFVQDEIRYLSVNLEFGGQIPAAPGVVLGRRFGDCKDKAFLLAQLLRRLGVPARPVLVNTALQKAVDDLLPMVNAFNHVIVEYEVAGKRRCVDATTAFQGGDSIVRVSPRFASGLPIGPGVERTEKMPTWPQEDTLDMEESFLLDKSAAVLRVNTVARGAIADAWRARLGLNGPHIVGKLRLETYQQFFSQVTRVGELRWVDDREANVLEMVDCYEITNAVFPSGEIGLGKFSFRAHQISQFLGFPESADRQTPFQMAYPLRVEHRITVDAPGLPVFQFPKAPTISPIFHLDTDTKSVVGRFTATFRLEMRSGIVTPTQWSHFVEDVQQSVASRMFHLGIPVGVAASRVKRQNHLSPELHITLSRSSRANPSPGDATPQAATASANPVLQEAAAPLLSTTAEQLEANLTAELDEKTDAPAPKRRRIIPEKSKRTSERRRRRRSRWRRVSPLWVAVGILASILVLVLVALYFAMRGP